MDIPLVQSVGTVAVLDHREAGEAVKAVRKKYTRRTDYQARSILRGWVGAISHGYPA